MTYTQRPFGQGGGMRAKKQVKAKSSLALANATTLSNALYSAGHSLSSTKTDLAGTPIYTQSTQQTSTQKVASFSERARVAVNITSASSTHPAATFFTFRVQLTFRLSPTSRGVNVAELFNNWAATSFKLLTQFILLPFDDENGIQFTSLSQIQDDKAFYATSFHNHRVLQHGNLTSMVHFQAATPWGHLKKPTGSYFGWLHKNKVFLNATKFKVDTLVPCRFLVGTYPSYFHRDEAEEEFVVSLSLDDQPIPFQLSSRNISVPIVEGSRERYSFQAVVVETSATHATALRERI